MDPGRLVQLTAFDVAADERGDGEVLLGQVGAVGAVLVVQAGRSSVSERKQGPAAGMVCQRAAWSR